MLEREWREASDMRRSTLPLLGVLAAAALLRFWSLGAGIPTAIGIDEPQIMNRAVHMMKSGSFNPNGFYDYPGLYLYVQMGVACVRFLAGAMSGEFRSLNDARPEDFYLWGRAVTAALGTLTVLVVFRIGLRWGTRNALLASALLAVAPLHVRESHYVLTDVPATFFVTLTFLLSLAAHEKPSAIAFAKAGAAAGLAAATKYPGVLAMILPLIGVWMTADVRPSRVTAALSAIAGGVLAFLLAAPYTILDLPGFLNGYAGLAAGYAGGTLTEPAWLTYLKHLRLSLRWPATLLIAAGLVLAAFRAVRGPGRVRWTLAIVISARLFLERIPADVRLRALSAANRPVPVRAGGSRRRCRRQSPPAFRDPTRRSNSTDCRVDRCGALAATHALHRLRSDDWPARHRGAGLQLGSAERAEGCEDRRGNPRHPPAAGIQLDESVTASSTRVRRIPQLWCRVPHRIV